MKKVNFLALLCSSTQRWMNTKEGGNDNVEIFTLILEDSRTNMKGMKQADVMEMADV